MEIKYTLEILTKDIQDIEKLVANLQNSPEGSTLELDLALSKLRNVYDILTAIRADMSGAVRISEKAPEKPVDEKPAESAAAKEKLPLEKEEESAAKPKAMRTRENAEILAEKFLAESSINENLGGSREHDMESQWVGQPIDSISRNIGINDRFLIIRELFNGDKDGFGKLIEDLDKAGDLQAANHLLEKKFEHSPDHEGVSILAKLVKRRYNRN
jgi:hypothetical protein